MSAPLLNIVVEGPSDAAILKKSLPAAIKSKCGFVVAQGRSSAISGARTLLVLSRSPVALVLDAGTTDASEIKKQETILRKLMQSASAGVEFEVLLAIPSLTEVRSSKQTALIKRLVSFVDSISVVMK